MSDLLCLGPGMVGESRAMVGGLVAQIATQKYFSTRGLYISDGLETLHYYPREIFTIIVTPGNV